MPNGSVDTVDQDRPTPFGVSAETGRPLPELSDETLGNLPAIEERRADDRALAVQKSSEQADFAVTDVDDANDLSETGWGVVFAQDATSDTETALAALLEHRQRDAKDLFRVFKGADGYKRGETARAWLERHGVTFNPVSPTMGVPFYLLLVGSAEEIPLEFQYSLDIYWAVGRLHFDDPGRYRTYAESVVSYETGQSVAQSRKVAHFATRHDFDRATQLFAKHVAEPLASGDGKRPAIGQKQKFSSQRLIGDDATKENLAKLLRGQLDGAPALLVSGTHGMALKHDDPRLPDVQGALVCADWEGYGAIGADSWFAAADLPADARVHGLIHFFFACYSTGCPDTDTFENRPGIPPKRIAPRKLFSQLPQALLGHAEGGALATIGHVDRAWSYSFKTTRAPQLQGFRSVLNPILSGHRVGNALDQFNIRWAALTTEIADKLRASPTPEAQTELANLWVARDDARNYIVFGDPAVRLRVEDLQTQ
jgi:hypothetical protein